MIYDISDEDVKKILNLVFEPQKVAVILERCKLVPAGSVKKCTHPRVERVQLGTVDDPAFAHLSVGYKCMDCGTVMDVKCFKEKEPIPYPPGSQVT